MPNANRKTKYWIIASAKEYVERKRYIYVELKRREKHPLWQLLHEINLGWKDDILIKRKQVYVTKIDAAKRISKLL